MDDDFSPRRKTRPWREIAEHFAERRTSTDAGSQRESLAAIEALATYIAEGPLASLLFGWTSMFDLCIQQTDTTPGRGPFLKVAPTSVGTVDFRYCDTAIPTRQWHRAVPPEAVLARFAAFLDQLHWVAR